MEEHKPSSFCITVSARHSLLHFFGNLVDNCESVTDTSSVVRRGSVPEPLLFLLFVSDSAQKLDDPGVIFVDDVKVPGEDITQDLEAVQR